LEWSIFFSQIVARTQTQQAFYASKHFELDQARNQAVLKAINEFNPTHLMFIDSDIIPHLITEDNKLIFYPEVINLMLSYHYPIVSGTYFTSKMVPNTFKHKEGMIYEPVEFKPKEIMFTDACGLGFCLIDARVFLKLMEEGLFPWFEYISKYESKEGKINVFEMSEDINFFDKCRKLGFSVMVLGQIFCLHEFSGYVSLEKKVIQRYLR
jgi:hypothetical protein